MNLNISDLIFNQVRNLPKIAIVIDQFELSFQNSLKFFELCRLTECLASEKRYFWICIAKKTYEIENGYKVFHKQHFWTQNYCAHDTQAQSEYKSNIFIVNDKPNTFYSEIFEQGNTLM